VTNYRAVHWSHRSRLAPCFVLCHVIQCVVWVVVLVGLYPVRLHGYFCVFVCLSACLSLLDSSFPVLLYGSDCVWSRSAVVLIYESLSVCGLGSGVRWLSPTTALWLCLCVV